MKIVPQPTNAVCPIKVSAPICPALPHEIWTATGEHLASFRCRGAATDWAVAYMQGLGPGPRCLILISDRIADVGREAVNISTSVWLGSYAQPAKRRPA